MTLQSRPSPSMTLKPGPLGEAVVAEWLVQQGGQILQRQWQSRWGEVDLIALLPDGAGALWLAFVEVKTRGSGNWDADGLLAVTPKKQEKISLTAQTFLAEHTHYGDYPCRFDVALVHYRRLCRPAITAVTPPKERLGDEASDRPKDHSSDHPQDHPSDAPVPIVLGQACERQGIELTVMNYIPHAFVVG